MSAALQVVAALNTPDPAHHATARVPAFEVDLAGIPGNRYYGRDRVARGWEGVHPRGTRIRNRRQLTAVSVEECAAMARLLELDELRPEWLGANLLLAGTRHLSALPAGTVLVLPSGATLLCEGGNAPCATPGRFLQALHPDRVGLGKAFVRAATGRRGILLSVERAGRIAAGDEIEVVPPEPVRAPLVADPDGDGAVSAAST